MNRRGFLGALAGAIAGASLDPEQLLWTPGRKLISIPSIVEPPWICPNLLTKETLKAMERSFVFHPTAFLVRGPRIGDTVNVRVPQRFVARVGVAHGRGRLKA
jgi:hypothetical protein